MELIVALAAAAVISTLTARVEIEAGKTLILSPPLHRWKKFAIVNYLTFRWLGMA
jgi:hypothetical protein